jgi:predicted PurR-regulated permease PerM
MERRDDVAQVKGPWRGNGSLIIFVIVLILAFLFLYAFRSELLPFGVGLVLVSIIQPVIVLINKNLHIKGKLSIILRLMIMGMVMLIILLIILGLFIYFVANVVSAFTGFLNNSPQFFNDASIFIDTWLDSIKHQLPFQIDFNQLAGNIGTAAGDMLKGFFVSAFTFVPTTFGLILGFLTLPVFIFFILKDSITIRQGLYEGLPHRFTKHASNISSILFRILGHYIRALFFSSIIIGILVFAGLLMAGLPLNLAVSLAVFAGFCEWIPPVGIWISLVLVLIMTLAVSPSHFIWVLIVYLAVILIEALLVSPRFHGRYLKINPGIMMVLMVIGSTIAGLWGMVLINPFAQTILEIYKYTRDTMQGEVGEG